MISGVEGTCAVLEQQDGSLMALPPIEIVPAEGVFDYHAKYIAKATQEICPGRFASEVAAALKDQAMQGPPRVIVQRLFAFGFYRLREGAGLS